MKIRAYAFTIVTALTLPAIADAAKGHRRPLEPSKSGTSRVDVAEYGATYRVERARTTGREKVRFSAAPAEVPEGAVFVFEIASEGEDGSIPRWRCVALRDVSECLGEPVAMRWVAGDERAVLTVRAEPLATDLGRALVREAIQRMSADMLAQRSDG